MVEVVRDTGVGVCVMHMKGTPQTMQQEAVYRDVVAEVTGFLESRCRQLEMAGIKRDHIAIDPGLGFAKTPLHNWQIIAGLQRLRDLGYPLIIGHSRKRFLREVVGTDPRCILQATVGVGVLLAAAGIDVLRIHDVKAMRQTLDFWQRNAVGSDPLA
jgi:dihydropteroate synthase